MQHTFKLLFFIFCYSTFFHCEGVVNKRDTCEKRSENNSNDEMTLLAKLVVPDLEGTRKGDSGKIAVVGGSAKYTGAPYFAAISALKVGADLVYVITTEEAASVIKSYSPDLIVIPNKLTDIRSILSKVHVVVLGPGLGREPENLQLAYDTIQISRDLKKPLVIDADGLYAVYKNISVLKDYPEPGVVLTPNFVETKKLIEAIPESENTWYSHWGNAVSVLLKGATDEYHGQFDWHLDGIGSGRRAGGQGDILAGALGTFYHWSLQHKHCNGTTSEALARSTASFAAAKLTRVCNAEGFKKYGRSMTASDMINEIHVSFDKMFL
ncbi:ATP-dependent (S)-NAD(P)H-hydrate dehydratase-like [Aricia agestis]|uniref:ATP-dependent (S)-NAD(P)H-hydrate dehydratase-like n=1 Tax=Aricia agestis TaxID=91739 RepID=UPI001C2025E2|nr:ATP-dependent (S)-NAD(P)H-hydrate dehydratase-like [Aricia agestis]